MQLIDIGANLSNKQFNDDLNQVIDNAFANQISQIYSTTTDKDTFFSNIAICEKYPNIFTTWGLHPHNANVLDDFILQTKKHTNHPKVKAIGEFGLDFFRMISDQKSQENAMNYFLSKSNNLNLPLFMHEREAHDTFVSILKNNPTNNYGVVHCFTGTKKQLLSYLDLNLYIGITGWICDDRRNHTLLEAIKFLPLDKIMIETDSPYLKPRNLKQRSPRNEPKNLIYILNYISELKNIPVEELSVILYNNTLRFFNNGKN